MGGGGGGVYVSVRNHDYGGSVLAQCIMSCVAMATTPRYRSVNAAL